MLPLNILPRTPVIGAAAALLLGVTVVTGSYLGAQTQRRVQDISTSWFRFAEEADRKGAWISDIRGYLGYGGIIHNFKNYVLRQDEAYLRDLEAQLARFYGVLDAYAAQATSPDEKAALTAIRSTVAAYESRIPVATTAAAQRWPIGATDRLVRVDDAAAISALNQLEAIWRGKRQHSTSEIVSAVGEGEALIGTGHRLLWGLAAVVLTLLGLFYLLLRERQRAVDELSAELAERQRIEQSEKKFSRAVEQSPATIVITDTNGRIEYVNRRFEELTGYSRQETIGQTPRLLQSGDTPAEDYARLRMLLAGGEEWHGLFRNRKKRGGVYWAETTILPLKSDNGTVSHFIGIGEDVTEKRKAREQVIRAQKMEAVGLLAGGVAHDFNNILTTILGNAHLARLDVADDSEVGQELEQIEIAAQRAQSLVQQLLSFAKRQPAEPRPVDLRQAVGEVVRLIRASIRPTITLRFAPGDRPVCVSADPTHLHQVIMNLCRNAAEAIAADSGEITLQVQQVDGPPAASGLPAARPGGWVCLTVSDTGPGIAPDVGRKIFDPFFTTKPIGKGTGLGLTVVASLVEDMGGHISFDSNLGRGTVFSVFLPGTDAAGDAGSQRAGMVGGHERILLVDDESDIVATYRKLLLRLGYRVDGFVDPKSALDAFRADPSRYDLVITDLVMPDLSGETVAREIWRLRADCPVIICTGYRPQQLVEALPHRVAIMDKPMNPPTLAQRMRELLDGSGEAGR